MAFEIEKIEEKIDRVATAGIELSDEGSGISIKRLIDAMEIAKLMAVSKQAVPQFMRGEPGLCYACVVRAVRWGFDPFFVAEQSYLVRNPKSGEEKIAYMAQLMVAVINARAPLENKLRAVYSGEGENMKATIYGTPKGEKEPLEYETPTIAELIAVKGRNDAGNVKGSPLYENDPKQALWYYGARGFCRRHFPEVLGGIYDRDEFEQIKDVTPETGLARRLKDKTKKGRGFDHEHVEREATAVSDAAKATGTVIEGEQLDIEVEAKLKKAFDDGKSAPDGAKAPTNISEAEAVRWTEGYHSVKRETVDAQ